MAKKLIALVAGGDSGEYQISMASSRMIKDNIDPDQYSVYLIVMRGREWVCHLEDGRHVPVDKDDFSLVVDGRRLRFDCVFITIHGTPGEDGRLQAYYDLLGIPYTTAGVLASALTFNKYFSYQMVRQFGADIPPSVLLRRSGDASPASIIAQLGLPLFVKPNEGGSSLGMSLVRREDELGPAIELAFRHDKNVLIDKYLEGTELTCGVFSQKGRVVALPVTEIISKTKAAYFDFEAKYTPGAADEITPARISEELSREVQEMSVRLYQSLNLAGLTRFDYIAAAGKLYFLEVNVTPGMTETSLVPQQAAVAGISNKELFSILIEEALGRA